MKRYYITRTLYQPSWGFRNSIDIVYNQIFKETFSMIFFFSFKRNLFDDHELMRWLISIPYAVREAHKM